MNKPTILVVAAAIIDADNRVLIQTRTHGKYDVGMWEFPGGKPNGDEKVETALKRELFEELGVETIEKAFFPLSFTTYEFETEHVLLLLFGVRNWTGQIAAKEGQETAWVRPARLSDYQMRPSNVPLIAPLLELI